MTFRSTATSKASVNRELHHALLALVALLLIFYTDFVSAQTTTVSGTSQTQITNTRLLPESLSLTAGIEYAEETAQLEGSPKRSSMGLSLGAILKINERLTSTVDTSFNQESTEDRQILISDFIIGLAIKGMALSEKLKTVHSLSGLVPTSESTIKTERLKTSISAQNGLSWQMHPKFSTTYRLGLTKNFHEFNVNADGRANIEYRLAHRLDLKLNVTDAFYATAMGSYRIGRTYEGNERYGFQFAADLNYDLNANWSINLGTSNEGSALKPNGVDSNISLFDENTSVIRLGLSATL